MAVTEMQRRATRFWSMGLCLGSAILLAISWRVGPYVFVPITFIIPVGLMAWLVGRWASITLGVAMSLARYILVLVVWEPPGLPTLVATINFAMLAFTLVGVAWLISLAAQAHALAKRVRILEGLLSICSYCKKIHRKDGKWEQLESYLSEHTNARFSHCICPKCAHEFFPEVFPNPDA